MTRINQLELKDNQAELMEMAFVNEERCGHQEG